MQKLRDVSKGSRFAGDLRGTRILVTGGSGFIGSHIIDLLVEAGCDEIVAVDNMVRGRPENLKDALGSGRVRLVQGDIRDRALMDSLVKGTDVVFHQAALRITQCAAEPRQAFEVMATATFDLLERCVEAGVAKVVMASSASVYGMAESFPTTEKHHPYDNRTLYGAAKSFGEGLLRSFNDMYGLDYVALRYFNAYGPRMDLTGRYTEVMVRWMQRLAEGQSPIVFGDGLQTMDLVHVRDIARANILSATAPATDVVLNVGTGLETSLVDLAGHLTRIMGRDGTPLIHEAERAVNPVPRRLCDTSLARDLIGFEAKIGPAEGLADLVSWWSDEAGSDHLRRALA